MIKIETLEELDNLIHPLRKIANMQEGSTHHIKIGDRMFVITTLRNFEKKKGVV